MGGEELQDDVGRVECGRGAVTQTEERSYPFTSRSWPLVTGVGDGDEHDRPVFGAGCDGGGDWCNRHDIRIRTIIAFLPERDYIRYRRTVDMSGAGAARAIERNALVDQSVDVEHGKRLRSFATANHVGLRLCLC